MLLAALGTERTKLSESCQVTAGFWWGRGLIWGWGYHPEHPLCFVDFSLNFSETGIQVALADLNIAV